MSQSINLDKLTSNAATFVAVLLARLGRNDLPKAIELMAEILRGNRKERKSGQLGSFTLALISLLDEHPEVFEPSENFGGFSKENGLYLESALRKYRLELRKKLTVASLSHEDREFFSSVPMMLVYDPEQPLLGSTREDSLAEELAKEL